MPEVCVVHLVWAPLGLDPFAQFVDSYRAMEAGMDHDLVVVFNGFRAGDDCREYHRLLGGLPYRALVRPRPGQDIAAYYAAARHSNHSYSGFVNSYTVFLEAGWLATLSQHIIRDGVGLVGATGSYETRYPSGGPLPPFPWRAMLGALRRFWFRTVAEECRWRREWRYKARHFCPYPNPHIRTN